MERQNALFYECIEDAIADDIKALGGPKKAAAIFFPDKTTEQGAALLRAWSNADRSERPSPSQYILLKAKAKDQNSFACVLYEEQTLGCKVSWIEPEDELQRIERENNELLKALTKRMERADTLRSQLKAVEGGRR